MTKFCKTANLGRSQAGYIGRMIIAGMIALAGFCNSAYAQVTLTATQGLPTGNYTNITQAFNAINSGSHKGDIIINITANTNEGSAPATLNSSNADPAGYNTILIQPTANNIIVTGDPGAGFGVIQLNGADNVSINGDNPNVAGQNRNLTIINSGSSSIIGGSCIRIATSAVVSSADNISILNCVLNGNVVTGNTAGITSATSSSAISFGIYAGGNGGATATTAPSAITASMEAAPAGTSIKTLLVQNNAVNQCGKGIFFNGANATVSNAVTITQNLVGTPGPLGSFPYTTPATTVYTNAILVAGTSGLSITSNDIHNIFSYVATEVVGIELSSGITGSPDISDNIINGVVSNTGTNLTAAININALSGQYSISGNNITTIENDAAATTSPATAIRINAASSSGTIAFNKIAGIYNRGGGPAQGIGLAASGNAVNIYNNFIAGVLNDGSVGFGNTANANGILLNSGSNHKIYYNSINLYGASGATGTNSINCLAITAVSQTEIDIRNNLFSNKVTGGSASNAHTCLFMPFAASASMNLTLNNNAYYTGSTAGLHGIAFAGAAAYAAPNLYTVTNFNPLTTAGASNWRNFSSSLGDGANDFASFGSVAAAPFVSATDLHIPAATATQLESGGTPVNISNDIDNNVRNATFPDIGADEFSGVKVDNTAPLINYTPLRNICSIGNRQLTITVTDPSGVPTAGLGLPVLYWRINALPYLPATAAFLGGSNYQFTFGAGAILGDVVSYYIVAQDGDATPNVTSSPSTGASGYTANPPAALVPPTFPESYTLVTALNAGTYTVGAGFTYTTLTAAINDYNNSCLNGPVIFTLMDASYPSESYPIIIDNPEANATNTLTIVPNAGVTVTVTGNNASTLFKLNGADYITFDGLNTGGSSLTLSNTSATGSVFWIASGAGANAATHNTVTNCGIKGGGTAGTGYGVISGDASSQVAAASAANSNNSISSCTFKSLQDGIYINGNPVLSDDNWVISGNTFGSATASDKLGYRGITLNWVDNFTVTGNTINGIVRNSVLAGTHTAGIGIYNSATNGIISKNKIGDVIQSGTVAGSYGLILQSAVNASNVAVNNNFIYDIGAQGNATLANNACGILVGLGGGYNIYFNSVGLIGLAITSNPTITSAIRISANVTTAASLNIRNNIFSNLANFGTRYSIYCEATAAVFGTINNNDYFFTGAQGALGFLAGSIPTLPGWQAATGDDARSLVINPLFTAAANLHLLPASPLNGFAVTIAGLTTDIDGDTRSATPDIGADEFDATDCSGTPGGGTIAASLIALCNSGSALLTATGFTAGDGISYQWQSSTDNFASAPNNMAGQTIPTNANTGIINTTTFYRLAVTCSIGGATGYSNVVSITVNNPAVLTTTPASRCGTGIVTLTATASGGANLNWFSAATGGASLGFGPTFITTQIAATTTYYVEASISSSAGTAGPATPTAEGGSIGIQTADWHVYFDVLQATTLQAVDIFPNTTGLPGTIIVRNSSGVALATVNYTTSVSGGATAQTILLNVALTPGTGYYLDGGGSVPSLTRNESGAVYPYNSPVIKITGNGFDNTYYMCYYNFRFTGACTSARTPVIATINTAPAIVVTATPSDICAGSSSVLTATSSNAGYTYLWQPGGIPGATITVTPGSTTTYSVTASDITGGPNNGCALKGSVTVNVRAVPTAVTVTPPTASVCVNTPATQLLASGGILTTVTALTENFNGSANGWTSINNSTGGTFPANPAWTLRTNGYISDAVTFNSNDASQFYLSNSYSQGSGSITSTYLKSPAFSLTGYTTANLSFWHYFRYNSGETALVEASTDDINWIPIPGGAYTSSQGTSNGFVNANLNIDSYAGQPVVYIRFNYQASWDWWWAVDNINITGNVSTTMTWTQAPLSPNSMFTDAGASIPYTLNTNAGSIYVQPGITTVYTATATSPIAGNCKSTATSTITVTPPVSVTISASANPACPSANITFAATVVNGGPAPTYQWQINGANVGTNSATYSNNSLITGDKVNVIVIGNGPCTFGNPASSDTITMSVAPPSGVSLTIAVSPGTEVCVGVPVTFTATPTNGGLNPIYQWQVNGGNVGTNSATYVTTTLANGDQVTCTMTSNSPCISGSPTAVSTNQILMTVNPYGPTAAVIGTTLGSNTVCAGTVVTVRATPTNQGHAPVYEFFLNNISQGTQSSNDFIFTPVNGDKVKVKLVSNYTCLTGPNNATSNTITMTVLTSAAAGASLAASASLCSGTPITFTATASNGGLTPNYNFLLNGVSAQNGTSNIYTLASPVNGNTVQVIMTSTFGCVTGNPASSAIYTVALNTAPTVSASANCTTILSGSGQVATLTAVATAGSGTITFYQWILNGVTNVGINSPTYATTVAGSYTVKVTNSNGCSTTTTATPIVITVSSAALAAGTYIIPDTTCLGFDKISSAVNYINAHGISGAGGVVFNIAAGYAETAPVGGYAITATGTATNSITFQRNGAGAKPVITAGLQVAGTNSDGIFKLIGSDYIVIKNLLLKENPGNTIVTTGATNTMTEWGIALLYSTTTDGPNNNTIQDDSISLNRTYPNSFGIYSNLRHSPATPATSADITNATGGLNKIYGNVISNVNTPLFFLSAGTSMSNGNDIGGSSAATANTLINWGSNTAPNAGNLLFGVPATITGIYAVNQTALNISWNSITNASSMDAGAAGLHGIYTDFIASPPSGTFTNAITHNTVLLTSISTTGSFEAIIQGNTVAAAAVAGFTLNINNNLIGSVLTGTASASTITGISNVFPCGVLSISDNIIKGNSSTATTGGFTGISNSGAVSTTININTNQFGDATTDAVDFSAATNGAVQGISNSGAAAAAVLSMNGNSFTKFAHTITGTSIHTYVLNSVSVASQNINTNSFTNINTNSNGALTCISTPVVGTNKVISGNTFTSLTGGSDIMKMIEAGGGSNLCNINNNNIGNNIANSIKGTGDISGIDLLAIGTATVTSNTITGLSCTGTGASLVVGIRTSAPTVTVTSNNINTITSSGTGSALHGIYVASGTTVNASLNTINALTGTATGGNGTVNGISVNAGTTVNVLKNKIYNLTEQLSVGGTGALVNGLVLAGGTTITAYNNFISDLKTPVANIADAIHGIAVTSVDANSTYNIYYNSIYLNASSTGTDFGTSALFHTGNATATTAVLNLRNNIIDNESVASGAGRTVALRKTSIELANYAATSNNNLFFAGSLAIPGLLFYDGTNSETTIAGLQTRLAIRESLSITAVPTFVSATDLHILTIENCGLDGTAAPIPGITDDIDADVRNAVTPDIGADEFNGTGGGIGVWKGINTNWMDPGNWCGEIPTATMDVTIPSGRPFYPIIITAAPVAKNITIVAGGTVTITGIGKLGIYGAISNAGLFNVADGTIELPGSTAQTIPAGAFQNNDLKNLIISNTAAASSVSLAGALNIYGKVSFTGNNKTFATNDNLTLKSSAAGTASVGDLTSNNIANNNNAVTGDVMVERFITARRAWRFLSVPTQNNLQSIHVAWQENQVANSTTPAGLGTQITSDLGGWSAAGFDMFSAGGPSLKTYNPAGNSWIGVPTTLAPFVTGRGYMTFIRGDRTANFFGAPVTTTVLRDKGALKTYDFAVPAIGAGQFAAIGNPYPSAVDFTKLTRSNLQDIYYMWDPQMGTFGAYVTFAGPTYNPTGSISYNTGNNFIESGQAFFVHSSGTAGALTFTEQSKVDGSNLVTRLTGIVGQLRTNLYVTTGDSSHLYDGVIADFDDAYSASADALDALKLTNFGENLGMMRGDKNLSVERRPGIAETDTIFYSLKQLRIQNYQFEFIPSLLQPGLTGFLEDKFLHSSTPIDMTVTSRVDFQVTNVEGSYAPDRFKLVFKQIGPVPVTFTGVRANKQDADILVEWKVENQLNIHHYEVEKSADGLNFSKVNEQAARGSGSTTVQYYWLDTNPLSGDNFYRIRSVGSGGEVKFSQVVKVNMNKLTASITVFPNPVQDDKMLYISLSNKPTGKYDVKLLNNEGQTILTKSLNHAGGNGIYSIQVEKLIAHGGYLLYIYGVNDALVFKILY